MSVNQKFINSWHTVEHYVDERWEEHRWYKHGMLRPGDMDSAVGYALGIESYSEVRRILGPAAATVGESGNLLRSATSPVIRPARETVGLLKGRGFRGVGCVVDVGCGRGEVAAAMAMAGAEVYAVDPSPGSAVWVERTMKGWLTSEERGRVKFINRGILEAMPSIPIHTDTFIFCEALEHIETEDMYEVFGLLEEDSWETEVYKRVVVTNWMGMHPIAHDGKGHINTIDDDLFQRMERLGELVYRESSHLVVDI